VRGPFELPAYPPPQRLLRQMDNTWGGLVVKIKRSPMPARYSSVDAAYAGEPEHSDLAKGVHAALREAEAAQEDATGAPDAAPDIIIPPAPVEVRAARKSLAYYQSFGEGLTINLALPLAPPDAPPPPDDAGRP
jgi:hypothetical protein